MGRWEKLAVACAATLAIAGLTAVEVRWHHNRAQHQRSHQHVADIAHVGAPSATSAATPSPLASNDPQTTSDPVAAAPVVPHYDPGKFTDVDPKPATYELRAWAYMDRQTGFINGSDNSASAHNSTESMIKAWIASDYFRRLGSAKPSAERLRQVTGMIRDSDDQDAQAVWAADGRDEVVERLIQVCGLRNTKVWHEWWSRTQITAQDAVRMGACIADGTAAGPKWTTYVLNEMRHVRGEGRFGIVKALPAEQQPTLAIKNGWTAIGWDHDQWHVNCLGVTDDWVLVIQVKYPDELGLKYGAGYCQAQAAKILSTF